MAQLTGIVYIKVNSELLQSLPGATLDVGGFERAAVKGYALYGFTEQFKEAMVSCTIAHGANTDLVAMRGWSDVTITFECDSGPTYTVARAFLTKPPVLTAGADSNVALEFIGEVADQA
jgi:hypothetical protein